MVGRGRRFVFARLCRPTLTVPELMAHPNHTVDRALAADRASDRAGGAVHTLPRIQSDSIAYMMYTSGSTGKPKGVMTTHRNIIKNSVNNGYIELSDRDRILQISNYAFDGSTFDIFGALLNGSTLVLIPKEHVLDAALLARAIEEQDITVIFMTTALFNTMVDYDPHCFRRVRKLFFGGEVSSSKHVWKALECLRRRTDRPCVRTDGNDRFRHARSG